MEFPQYLAGRPAPVETDWVTDPQGSQFRFLVISKNGKYGWKTMWITRLILTPAVSWYFVHFFSTEELQLRGKAALPRSHSLWMLSLSLSLFFFYSFSKPFLCFLVKTLNLSPPQSRPAFQWADSHCVSASLWELGLKPEITDGIWGPRGCGGQGQGRWVSEEEGACYWVLFM